MSAVWEGESAKAPFYSREGRTRERRVTIVIVEGDEALAEDVVMQCTYLNS